MLKNRCLKELNILKCIDCGADITVLLNSYWSLIRSKLDYGCIDYSTTRPSYVKLIDTVHHQGLRHSLGVFRTSPIERLYVEANAPSLENRHIKLGMQYATKSKAYPANPEYDCAFDAFHERDKLIVKSHRKFWYKFGWHRIYCNYWKPSMVKPKLYL